MSDHISPQFPPQVPPQFPPQVPPHLPPQPVYYVPPRTGGFGKMLLFFALGVVFVFVCGAGLILGSIALIGIAANSTSQIFEELESAEKKVNEKFVRGNKDALNKIAILTISGVITSEEDGYIAKQIKAIQEDENVKAVVLRVESPGGTMAGSDYYLYLLQKMKESRKLPVVVSMGSVAASGGYYVSMVGDEIYAEPSTITGSIGVIVSLFDGSELFKKVGVESTPITSGPFKAMGSFAKKMGDEERKIWQHLVDDSFARFKDVILNGRKGLAKEELDKLATGQIYTAKEAVDKKLADKIGFVDDAVASAIKRANLLERDTKTIRYKPKQSFVEALSESRLSGQMPDVKTLQKVTTPQVYLLCPYTVPVSP